MNSVEKHAENRPFKRLKSPTYFDHGVIILNVKNSSPNTKLVFSSVILRKDKKDISKKVGETNQRLKNCCKQKNIDFVDNSNIIEEQLGNKKLHLKKEVTLF